MGREPETNNLQNKKMVNNKGDNASLDRKMYHRNGKM